ncbi:MAG TPA: hypothetical protein VNA15_01930 [Candidatus Angelobacter sp.]|nr:hypothetical protein [Candidatus Angelobacter sp.]
MTLMVVVIVGAALVYVYYSIGMASVTGIRIDEVFADRNYVGGTFPNRNATFTIEVQVWSNAQALNVRLEKPTFVVELSGVPNLILGSDTRDTSSIIPGAYLTYNLRFNINENKNFAAVSLSGNNVLVNMTTIATAGLFSHSLTERENAAWNWTTATLTLNAGCFDYTFNIPC